MNFESISMIGLGYIGLPTAAVLASRKVNVIGVDVNQNTVNKINEGKIHIIEPDLDVYVRDAVNAGYLKATTTPEKSDAFIIAVPTPFKGDNHEPDLKYINQAVSDISQVLEKGNLIILESTSPVGTTRKIAEWLAEKRPDLSFPHTAGDDADINIAYCPERVLPGQVIRELVENDRVVGGLSNICTKKAISLYEIFVEGECLSTNAQTAEMSKLTENAFRDVNIAFSNELSLICHESDINVWELIKLANHHPRVNILHPGCGVGGHCIAVDPWFIVNAHPEQSQLIATSRKVNDNKPKFVINQITSTVESITNPKIACLGLSFKPNIDDLRESPALEITKQLSDIANFSVLAVEPNINELPEVLKNRKNITLCKLEDALKIADIIVILVSHDQFQNKVLYENIKVFDFCGALQ